VTAASGGTPVRLTFDPADDTHPDWSADGSKIVFLSTRLDGITNFYLATDLPDFRTSVDDASWTTVKHLYR
jgi:Tol biopolymer transport system component